MAPGSIIAAARRYAEQGFRPVPLYGVAPDGRCLCGSTECKPRDAGKHEPPETDGLWKDGVGSPLSVFHDGMNIALAMGPQPSGVWLVALDADGPWDWSRLGPLPRTWTAKSPRGEHRLFRVPAFEPLGNWVDCFNEKPGPSLDLRYARGRIVVAPSRGAYGVYRWVDDTPPAELPRTALGAIYGARRARGLPILPRWSRGEKRA